MTFTDSWNEKFQEFVDGEKDVARVMEHRTIDENTEIYCLVMEDKSYQLRLYSKGKGKVISKHEKSVEVLEAYRELRDELRPVKTKKEKDEKKPVVDDKKVPAKKKAPAKKASAKKAPAKKTLAKKSGKANKDKINPNSKGNDFWDE